MRRAGHALAAVTLLLVLEQAGAPLWVAQANGRAPFLNGGGGRGSMSGAIDQIERSVTRPLPSPGPPPASRPDPVWVPDRTVAVPGGTVYVPGHWEQPIPNTGDNFVPPLVVCTPTGNCTTEPAGARKPPEQRQSP